VQTTLRIGYLGNLTHAPALIGLDQGYWAAALGPKVTIQPQTFNAGGDEVTAFLGGALDAAFMGPGPATNAFVKSGAVRVVAGATSGGAGLVLKGVPFGSAADLKGKLLATPQLANTQDIALRAYLLDHGLHTDAQGGGDVRITSPASNSVALSLFKQGAIQGAWEPEPWVTRMVVEGGGTEVVNEASLWPNGQFATTLLVVSTDFLSKHPDVVKNLIKGHLATLDWIQANGAQASSVAAADLLSLTNSSLTPAEEATAWSHLSFTADPEATSIKTSAANSVRVGLVTNANVNGIVDIRILNQLLKNLGRPVLSAGGLGSA
jgi:NitT/TauT family transport system substrate-binding protein